MVSNKSIAIVGAGVAGITTAYFLGKKGYKIRLFDPDGVAHQCSYANGGQLSVCNAEVWNVPFNIIIQSCLYVFIFLIKIRTTLRL